MKCFLGFQILQQVESYRIDYACRKCLVFLIFLYILMFLANFSLFIGFQTGKILLLIQKMLIKQWYM